MVFVAKAGSRYTGHLSFTFLVEEKATETGIQQNILPVACNPQVNTAVVLFARTRGSVDLVRAYMNALAPSADSISGYSGLTHPGYSPGDMSFPNPTAPGIYFSGQDLVLFFFLPLLQLLAFRMGFMQFTTLRYFPESCFVLARRNIRAGGPVAMVLAVSRLYTSAAFVLYMDRNEMDTSGCEYVRDMV